MDNIPRFSFYLSGVFVVSAAFTLVTSEFLYLITDPGWKGTAFLAGYGLVYMNIVFVVSRRFMRRLDGASAAPVVIAAVVALVPIIWIFIYQNTGFDLTNRVIYIAVLIFACGLGAHFGHRAGLKAQIQFRQKLEEYLRKSGRLPDELKRPHDNLNKN